MSIQFFSKILPVLFISCMVSCNSKIQPNSTMQKDDHSKEGIANQLINETSPYLLQHAYNPVDWHAWNAASLSKAKNENKLMIISIGYAACHWCHVMEHESFEDSLVASKMNDNYLPIKIDREERPDIDHIYMNAAHIITGRGGWPLNAIALSDGRPVFAGTYFPKEKWIQVLDYFANMQINDPEKLEEQAQQVTAGIRQADQSPLISELSDFSMADLDAIWDNWENRIDFQNGGRQGAPKFMMPNNWEFLLRYYELSGNEKVLKGITSTLNKMADGGLYDHAGGGFARYSTDAIWKVPHFEKMLYDNGQLISLYAHAYQLQKDPYYKQIVEETLAFVEREMLDKSGGFYSSLDADSEGVEGKFYIFTAEELKEIWSDNYKVLSDYFSIKENGNWEHSNILYRSDKPLKYFTSNYQLSKDQLNSIVKKGKAQVLAKRKERIRPGLDDKILTSWNALMLTGYIDAFKAFGQEHYKEMALKNANFILAKCKRTDGGLNRNYKNGQSTINGFLDDYSLTIEAFVALYQITFDKKWLDEALALSSYTIKHFYDEQAHMFFYTSDEDPALISRSKELSDNVISSSNSSMARALYYLGIYFYKEDYIDMAKKMLNNIAPSIEQNGPFYANWASLMTHFVKEPYEVAIVGKDYDKQLQEFNQLFLPNVILLGSEKEGDLALLKNKFMKGETTIYVCQHKTCKLPVKEVSAAIDLMK